jgi:prepilin-type N-terminal cleavage/methylation domain-containing protein
MKNVKGFTLIELLVVVIIIDILAAIALPQYRVAVLKSRFATVMSNTKAIKNAAEMYYLTYGEYPVDDITLLDIDMPGCSKNSGGSMRCPANNTAYNYNGNIGTGQRYEIRGIYNSPGGHSGTLEYTMVLDKDPSADKGKIFCIVGDTKNYAAVKVCESMSKEKVGTNVCQL